MKKLIICLIISVFTLCANAQKDVTQFLGIPVDGSKSEMVKKLKAKGFKTNAIDNNILDGQFNGADVNVYIATNRDKVCRIMVCDVNRVDERSIQIRFNNLCNQFENNPKYLSVGNELIPDDEDISYEISVNNKRYEASYYQAPSETPDTIYIREQLTNILQNKYTHEELENPTDEIQTEISELAVNFALDLCSKKSVWFMISDYQGKYYITMFYDNEYNRANGEDL